MEIVTEAAHLRLGPVTMTVTGERYRYKLRADGSLALGGLGGDELFPVLVFADGAFWLGRLEEAPEFPMHYFCRYKELTAVGFNP